MKHQLCTPTNIILIGFMGSGKSRLGKYLAKQLQYQFLDTDALIATKAGKSITKIFEQEGEEAFRQREATALAGLMGKKRIILATGGGILMNPKNQELARQLGTVVWLDADPDTLFDRATRQATRPLLNVEYPRRTFNELLATRRPLYQKTCHLHINTANLSYPQTAELVIKGICDSAKETS